MIPHIHTPECDAALELCLDRLKANCPAFFWGDCGVVVDDRPGVCPYQKWNDMAAASTAEVVLFINNDMVPGPGWHWVMECHQGITPQSVVTCYLTESGAIPVNRVNTQMNLGVCADLFERERWEEWVRLVLPATPRLRKDRGWYQPVSFNRKWFMDIGGYDTKSGQKFPYPLDILLFDRMCSQLGAEFYRAGAWFYHFQRLACGRDKNV